MANTPNSTKIEGVVNISTQGAEKVENLVSLVSMLEPKLASIAEVGAAAFATIGAAVKQANKEAAALGSTVEFSVPRSIRNIVKMVHPDDDPRDPSARIISAEINQRLKTPADLAKERAQRLRFSMIRSSMSTTGGSLPVLSQFAPAGSAGADKLDEMLKNLRSSDMGKALPAAELAKLLGDERTQFLLERLGSHRGFGPSQAARQQASRARRALKEGRFGEAVAAMQAAQTHAAGTSADQNFATSESHIENSISNLRATAQGMQTSGAMSSSTFTTVDSNIKAAEAALANKDVNGARFLLSRAQIDIDKAKNAFSTRRSFVGLSSSRLRLAGTVSRARSKLDAYADVDSPAVAASRGLLENAVLSAESASSTSRHGIDIQEKALELQNAIAAFEDTAKQTEELTNALDKLTSKIDDLDFTSAANYIKTSVGDEINKGQFETARKNLQNYEEAYRSHMEYAEEVVDAAKSTVAKGRRERSRKDFIDKFGASPEVTAYLDAQDQADLARGSDAKRITQALADELFENIVSKVEAREAGFRQTAETYEEKVKASQRERRRESYLEKYGDSPQVRDYLRQQDIADKTKDAAERRAEQAKADHLFEQIEGDVFRREQEQRELARGASARAGLVKPILKAVGAAGKAVDAAILGGPAGVGMLPIEGLNIGANMLTNFSAASMISSGASFANVAGLAVGAFAELATKHMMAKNQRGQGVLDRSDRAVGIDELLSQFEGNVSADQSYYTTGLRSLLEGDALPARNEELKGSDLSRTDELNNYVAAAMRAGLPYGDAIKYAYDKGNVSDLEDELLLRQEQEGEEPLLRRGASAVTGLLDFPAWAFTFGEASNFTKAVETSLNPERDVADVMSPWNDGRSINDGLPVKEEIEKYKNKKDRFYISEEDAKAAKEKSETINQRAALAELSRRNQVEYTMKVFGVGRGNVTQDDLGKGLAQAAPAGLGGAFIPAKDELEAAFRQGGVVIRDGKGGTRVDTSVVSHNILAAGGIAQYANQRGKLDITQLSRLDAMVKGYGGAFTNEAQFMLPAFVGGKGLGLIGSGRDEVLKAIADTQRTVGDQGFTPDMVDRTKFFQTMINNGMNQNVARQRYLESIPEMLDVTKNMFAPLEDLPEQLALVEAIGEYGLEGGYDAIASGDPKYSTRANLQRMHKQMGDDILGMYARRKGYISYKDGSKGGVDAFIKSIYDTQAAPIHEDPLAFAESTARGEPGAIASGLEAKSQSTSQSSRMMADAAKLLDEAATKFAEAVKLFGAKAMLPEDRGSLGLQ